MSDTRHAISRWPQQRAFISGVGAGCILTLAGGLLYGAVSHRGKAAASDAGPWRGFVYLYSDDWIERVDMGEFPSAKECRAAAAQGLHVLSDHSRGRGRFECGRNCTERQLPPGKGKPSGRPRTEMDCEETER